MARAWLSLSAGTSGAAGRLDQAEAMLRALPGAAVIARSPVVHGPSGGRDAELCRVVGLETSLRPRELLDALIAIEAAMGRDHRDVWGSRSIDLDILACDDIEIRSARLNLPHAFAHTRPHIIEPLRAIAPDVAAWIERVGRRPR